MKFKFLSRVLKGRDISHICLLFYRAIPLLRILQFHLTNLKVLSLHGNAIVYLPSIRPIAKPQLILEPTVFLRWLTYDVLVYIMNDCRQEGFDDDPLPIPPLW